MRNAGTRGGLVIGAVMAALVLPSAGTAGGELEADLTLTNLDSLDPVVTGTVLTYAIEVRNAGPAAATDLAMTDNLPGGTTVVSATPAAWQLQSEPAQGGLQARLAGGGRLVVDLDRRRRQQEAGLA